jgi:hypothetical protein
MTYDEPEPTEEVVVLVGRHVGKLKAALPAKETSE